MKVLNIHQRIIDQPKDKVVDLLNTLATQEDKIWPNEKWPRMKLDKGHQLGSKGGHGPIKYFVNQYIPGKLIQFKFTAPLGFDGVHRLDIEALEKTKTQITHTIDIAVKGKAFLIWNLYTRSLHDALIEDAFDKLQNQFDQQEREQSWSLWVKLLRAIFKVVLKRSK